MPASHEAGIIPHRLATYLPPHLDGQGPWKIGLNIMSYHIISFEALVCALKRGEGLSTHIIAKEGGVRHARIFFNGRSIYFDG